MRTFEGRVAVVTGAASGIGRAFAERFAQAGMKVVLADIEQEALNATVQALRQREFEVLGIRTDVGSAEAVEALARQALDAYGAVHVVCNNAGVVADADLGRLREGVPPVPMWELPLADWHWTFAVNFWGVVHGIRSFMPILLQQEEGHVVNTASIAGLTSGAGLPIYGATKHAVVRVSEALHLQLAEMGAPVKVSVLCPGGVTTRIAAAARNRPEEFVAVGAERLSAEEVARREQLWAARTGPTGMQPEAVAERVFQAIQDEQFYILTHDEYDDAIRARMESILARQNPRPRAF